MIKRFLLVLVLFLTVNLPIVHWQYENIPTLNGVASEEQVVPSTTWKDSIAWKVIDSVKTKITWWTSTFCYVPEMKSFWVPSRTNPELNGHMARTYLQVYLKDEKTVEDKSTILTPTKEGPVKPWSSEYSTAESSCRNFVSQSKDNLKQITGLYSQVRFLNSYFRDYPRVYYNGLLPLWMLGVIDITNTLSDYVAVLTIFNLIFCLFLYMTWKSENKAKHQTRLMNAFLYILIVVLIKIGLIGSILLLVTGEGLDFLSIFLPF